jgi:hypothetical protein
MATVTALPAGDTVQGPEEAYVRHSLTLEEVWRVCMGDDVTEQADLCSLLRLDHFGLPISGVLLGASSGSRLLLWVTVGAYGRK